MGGGELRVPSAAIWAPSTAGFGAVTAASHAAHTCAASSLLQGHGPCRVVRRAGSSHRGLDGGAGLIPGGSEGAAPRPRWGGRTESVSEEGSPLGPRASCSFTVTVEPGPGWAALAPKSSLSPTLSPTGRDGRPPSPRPCRLHLLPFSPANVSLLLHHTPAGAGLGSGHWG